MRRRSAVKWWLIGAAVVAIGLIAFCSWLVVAGIADDAKSAALDSTEQLLRTAASHPDGPLPKDDISSKLWIDEQCWTRLQHAMAKNVNRYVTEVTFNSDDIPNISHAHEEVGIAVIFSDRERIQVNYFQREVVSCY
ncbi:MAG TPA: hypothetical protein VMP08_12380 [Anaerolineae bacterium]|nr:hypothetical protein [Anaerolineae bacterium]